MIAALLIWKGSGAIRILGWLLLLMVAYYQISWVSPWFVMGRAEIIQEFKLHDVPFGSSPSVRWIESSNQLLLVPDEMVTFHPEPPEYNHVLVVDPEARTSHWRPKAEVNIDAARLIEYLPIIPNKLEKKSDYSSVGFSLPVLYYKIPWVFSETSGWRWEKTYFGLVRDVVWLSETGSDVVRMTQIVFNAPRNLAGASSRWVMDGKFLIFEPPAYIDRRVIVLGPFGTSQTTQSQLIDKNK
ncbi:hypothetical protein [Synechocystis sp. PCC 7509]|uniref:hypothetical protein n=1 Tax=Synechocystis sp. PCC 7509 TaxID=927677 RepID=UPI00048D8414|nr:hypothetical protein [Synechocystis sp. PCC 7509]